MCVTSKTFRKNVPRNFILMLFFWFDKIFIMVKWKSTCSYMVKLSAGIRQGGILSPYLFSVFVDSMLIKLKKSKLGCHISGQCLNAIMFADDVLLMSITLRDLQKMINLCVEELTELDLTVNIKKTVCLRLGKNYDNESISSLLINNEPVTWKNELKYLGVTILAGKTFKINLQTIRHKFYKALNGVFGIP